MSKSSVPEGWAEHPNWKNINEYAFIAFLSLHQYLWEFLRRNLKYRAEYAFYIASKNEGLKYKYSPPLNAGESEEDWMRRVIFSPHRGEPQKKLMIDWFSEKWNLIVPLDPLHPAPDSEIFRVRKQFPHLLRTQEDFEDLPMIEEDWEQGGSTRRLDDNLIAAVIRLSDPIDEQIDMLRHLLNGELKRPKNVNPVLKVTRPRLQPDNWLRHLRALDALRAEPKPKHAEIAHFLTDDPITDEMSPDRRGERICLAAKKMRDESVMRLLRYPNTTL